jgi:hypothetical protein
LVSGDEAIPEEPHEEPAAEEPTIDRRDFLRTAGMFSGSIAVGAAALRHKKVAKDGAASRTKSSRSRSTTRPSQVRAVTLPSGVSVPVADWVVEENARPGTLDWVVTYPAMLYGYADQVSATHGETVTLRINAPQLPYHVELYRAGYYGGTGGRLVWTSPTLPAQGQPFPTVAPFTNMVECDWAPSLAVTIDHDWPPGHYLFKVVGNASGSANGYVPLIVRDDTSHAAFMIMSAVTTSQAYNTWGGRSLYVGPGAAATRSRVVSFDRPYDGSAWGAPNFIGNEFPLVFLAESLGLDVTYSTDIDLHEQPSLLLNHRALFSLGHDEYWSQVMRTAADQAVGAGVNLAFLGANAIYRHIRLEASPLGPNRHQVCYKTDFMHEDPLWNVNPAEVTSDWPTGPMPRPEQTTIGAQYTDVGANAAMTIVNPGHWVFAGTGLTANQSLPGVIFGEYDFYDRYLPGPANVEILAHSAIKNRGPGRWSDMTYYTQPGGGGVLATGNAYFIYRLSNAPYIYPNLVPPAVPGVTSVFWRMMENVFSVFGAGPASVSQPSVGNSAYFYA